MGNVPLIQSKARRVSPSKTFNVSILTAIEPSNRHRRLRTTNDDHIYCMHCIKRRLILCGSSIRINQRSVYDLVDTRPPRVVSTDDRSTSLSLHD
ncbi:unnamed protein product [Macrosiphum euphorbiae]|uniref:Uncharacterized protein n=1 Tax=Macrosiphum euphorbiae TaxID=13131 RepID=A0AAV0VS39_9HEMI|nr:unnamed protein product [Macrosiphum euphorbiae]